MPVVRIYTFSDQATFTCHIPVWSAKIFEMCLNPDCKFVISAVLKLSQQLGSFNCSTNQNLAKKPYDSKTEIIQQGTDRHEISIALQNVRPRNVTLRLPITWELQWLVVLHSSWTVGDSKIWFDSTAAVWSNIVLGTNS